jgi:3-hydroxybutyryl-CoA dehydrogenase
MSPEKLGIVGSGTVACGLAATAALHGDVVVCARSDASASRAEARLAKLLARAEAGAPRVDVRIGVGLKELAGRTFIIEAVSEELEVKEAVLAQIGATVEPATIIATTTSSLSVHTLAQASGRSDRFVAFHVFTPVPRMQLVELAFPRTATPETRERAGRLALDLDKRPVEVPDTAGFVVNRLLFPYLFAAVRMAEEANMAPDEIDACMTLGAGHPTGPLALLDYVGLDVAVAIGLTLGLDVPAALHRLVQNGALGRKTRRGLYSYDDSGARVLAANDPSPSH